MAVDPALGIAIHRFPSDPQLTGLNRLTDMEAGPRLMRALLGKSFSMLAPRDTRIVRYKPERRCVVRLTDDQGAAVALRFYAPDQFEHAKRATKIYSALQDLHAARRLGHSDRQRVFAVEWIPGTPLADCVPQPNAMAWRTAGATLGRLHTHTAKPVRVMSPHSLQQALQEAIDSVRWVCPELQLLLTEVFGQLHGWLDDWSRSMVPVHGDFDTQQVLWNGTEARFIDLDNAALGPPAFDLANFLARYAFDTMMLVSDSWLEQLQGHSGIRAFLEGYASVAHTVDFEQLRPHLAYSLLRLAPLPFRLRQCNWPQRTADLVAAARQLQVVPPARTPRKTVATPRVPSRSRTGCLVHGVSTLDEDPSLQFMMPAMDPDVATASVARAVRDAGRDFQVDGIRSIRLVRHKPGRRCLIEYRCETSDEQGNDSQVVLLGKVHPRRLDKRAHDLQAQLHDGLGFRAGQQPCFVPETAGKIPAWHMWLQRQVSGTPLDTVLVPGDDALPLESVAEAIFGLHRSGLTTDRSHSRDDELEILADRFGQLSERQPAWSHRLARLLVRLRAAAESIPLTNHQLIHRDFYPAQVLLARDGVCLLDFDLASHGEAAVDVGNFCGHLRERGLRSCRNADAFRSLEQRFVDRYVELAGEELRGVIELYALLTMARLIYLSTILPHRSHVTESLYAWCEQSLKQYPICIPSK